MTSCSEASGQILYFVLRASAQRSCSRTRGDAQLHTRFGMWPAAPRRDPPRFPMSLLRARLGRSCRDGEVAQLPAQSCAAGGVDTTVVWTPEQYSPELERQAAAALAERTKCMPPAMRRVYERKAAYFWDKFYMRNTTNFFKDRHYLGTDFPDLARAAAEPVSLLEIGCGVGNAMFPLVEALPCLRAYGLDLSKRAIGFVRDHAAFDPARCGAHVCDVTRCSEDGGGLPTAIRDREPAGVDVALMLFMLSAMPPASHAAALKFAYQALKPGGVLLFRDYGKHDAAQLRFGADRKLADNFYVRGDGTCSYFFTVDGLCAAAEEAGFVTDGGGAHCGYIRRAYNIRKNTDQLHRVWVQARFIKPHAT